MLYVGSGLAGLNRWRAPVEPALVDPQLPVAAEGPDQGLQMGYWPSYSYIPAACRAAYLAWLAGGRANPAANIGYVFLFFYGIERRVLVDALRSPVAKKETPALLDEVRRLLEIYGANRSFRSYATNFLRSAKIFHEGVDLQSLSPPLAGLSGDGGLDLKMGLAAFAAQGRPVAAEWALAWLIALPEVNRRKAAHRCSEDFSRLFLLRYREAFGEGGIKLRPRQARLTAHYIAASPTFEGPILLALPDLPDLDLMAPPKKLRELGDRILEELEPYSRWIGRTGDTESPAALALLPRELTGLHESPAEQSFLAWVSGMIAGPERGVADVKLLSERWPVRTAGRFTRGDAEMLASFLAPRGYGVEPDARHEGFSPAKVGQVAFFQSVESAANAPNEATGYREADALLYLASTLNDGTTPLTARCELQLAGWFAERLTSSPGLQARFEARRLRLLSNPPRPIEVKNRIEGLGEVERVGLACVLVRLSTADGHVEPAYLPQLTKIYGLLGLPAKQVYSDIHAALSGGPVADQPVTVIGAGGPASGYALPAPTHRSGGPVLDADKIRAKMAETEQLMSLLAPIFDEPQDPVEAVAVPILPTGEDPYLLPGLDAPHSALLRFLSARASWDRQQVERLTRALGLLPQGALEVINEASFAACGEAVLEGDEVIEVRVDILEDWLHE